MHTRNILLLIVTTGLLSLFLPNNLLKSLYLHTEQIHSGEYWRIITGHFVYNSWQHWLINTVGIGLLLSIIKLGHHSKYYLVAICFLVFWISIGLLIFSKQLIWYVGFSGVLSGLYIYCAITMYSNHRWLSTSIIIMFFGFTAVQLNNGELVSGSINGLPSSSYAHALGVTGGLLFASLIITYNWLTTNKQT